MRALRQGPVVSGYFAFVLAWTWGWWAVPVVTGGMVWEMPWLAFLYLGGAGPLLGGLLFTVAARGTRGLTDLGARLVDPRRIGAAWWLAVLGLVPAIEGVAWLLAAAATGAPAGAVFAPLGSQLAAPLGLLFSAGFVLLLGPLPEEIGWRGYALHALQARFAPLPASLLLAAAWAAWHGPLFLMQGYYARFGAAPDPLHFVYDILLTTLLITWICNHTRRSVLAAVLFHFMVNFSEEIVAASPAADAAATVLTTLVVAGVIAGGGLRRRPSAAGGR